MMEVQLPNITAMDGAGQLREMRSYLYQMAKSLNVALQAIDRDSRETRQAAVRTADAVKKVTPENTFASLKSLIIKSADIVEAYSKVITEHLESVYVAKSEYGTFKETATNDIIANGEGIAQAFSNIQEIADQVKAMQANIKSGKLYEDEAGNPVYGLEVGQTITQDGETTFQKMARLTADRLSFFDGDGDEIAYLSGKRLYLPQITLLQDPVEDMEAATKKYVDQRIAELAKKAGITL